MKKQDSTTEAPMTPVEALECLKSDIDLPLTQQGFNNICKHFSREVNEDWRSNGPNYRNLVCMEWLERYIYQPHQIKKYPNAERLSSLYNTIFTIKYIAGKVDAQLTLTSGQDTYTHEHYSLNVRDRFNLGQTLSDHDLYQGLNILREIRVLTPNDAGVIRGQIQKDHAHLGKYLTGVIENYEAIETIHTNTGFKVRDKEELQTLCNHFSNTYAAFAGALTRYEGNSHIAALAERREDDMWLGR